MEIFITIQQILATLGIKATPTASFNGRLWLSFVLFAIAIVTSAVFLIYSAEVIMEYMQCFCIISALIEIGLCFTMIVLQKIRLFNYIDCMQKLINKSKYTICIWNKIQWKIHFEGKCQQNKVSFRAGKSNIQSNSRSNQSTSRKDL